MQSRPRKLIYLSCQRQAHEDRSLDQVCVDSRCTHHQLICRNCHETMHSGHQTMPLSKFIEALDNLKYNKENEELAEKEIRGIKQAKATFKEHLITLKEILSRSMEKLEGLLLLFDTEEAEVLGSIRKEKVHFIYDPELNLEDINTGLAEAVAIRSRCANIKKPTESQIKASAQGSIEVVQRLTDMVLTSTQLIEQCLRAQKPLEKQSHEQSNRINRQVVELAIPPLPRIAREPPPRIARQPLDTAASNLQQSRPQKFRFSRTLRQRSIQLQSTKHATSYRRSGGFSLALLQPEISTATICKVSFRMIDIESMCVGICIGSIVQQKQYQLTGDFMSEGVYALFNNGRIISNEPRTEHRSPEMRWQTDEIIRLEFNPATGILTYKKRGVPPLEQATGLIQRTDQSIYFCAGLRIDTEIGIV